MIINVTHNVDDVRKLYRGEANFKSGGKINILCIPIIALSSEEAETKLREYIVQEHPSVNPTELSYKISPELLVI